MLRRLFQFSVPSLLGVSVAALVAALAETIMHTGAALDALAGAGFLLAYALPLGLIVSLVARALYRGWRLDTRFANATDDSGASPRLAAWMIFLFCALVLQGWGSFQGMRLIFIGTRVETLVVLAAPLLALALSFGLVLLSRPIVGILERGISAIEMSRARAKKRPLFTARKLLLFLLVFLVLLATALWLLVLRPRVAQMDLGFVSYLVLFAVGVVLIPRGWQTATVAPGIRRVVAGLVLFLVGTCITASIWTRYQRPYSMLAIWGDTVLTGWAIDNTFDVQSLRGDLSIEGIAPKAASQAPHPNVVIITIDTLRADKIPTYGGKAKMPALKKLGRKSIVFDRAYSPGNVTRRSLPTLATGLSPRRVRGRVVGWALRIDPRHVLLAERFRAGGYETAGFFCCDEHFDPERKLGLVRGLGKVGIQYDGDTLAETAVAWLDARGEGKKPLFLWTHFIEPHNWARDFKSQDGASAKVDRYNLSLEATDSSLEILIAGIREKLGEDTIIVLTSDHGEGLGEHGVQHHSASLYNTEIRVPLFISGPGILPGRLEQAIGLVDLAPTLLELAGFEAPGMPHMDGLSVAPELRGEREDKLGAGEAYSVMIADRSALEDQAAIMSGRYKLIERPGARFQLYDMSQDPKERKDIKAEAPQLFRSMKARLARRQAVDAVSAF